MDDCGIGKRKVKKDDDLYTLQEFVRMVESGACTDYDGFGYYSDGKHVYPNMKALPSQIYKGMISSAFNYVVWFNK